MVGYNRTEATFFLASDPSAPKMTEEAMQKRAQTVFRDGSQRCF